MYLLLILAEAASIPSPGQFNVTMGGVAKIGIIAGRPTKELVLLVGVFGDVTDVGPHRMTLEVRTDDGEVDLALDVPFLLPEGSHPRQLWDFGLTPKARACRCTVRMVVDGTHREAYDFEVVELPG